jgi:hypothetical protein
MSREERIKRNAGKSQVLILTNKLDLAADWVVRELSSRGADVIRVNTEDLLQANVDWKSTGEWSICLASGRVCTSSALRSVWFRRPGRPYGERVLQDSPEGLLNAQWRAFLEGVLFEAPGVRWINHPVKNSQAESKIRQLRLAQQVGFVVPQTLVTNSAPHAQNAAEKWREGGVIKALDAPLVVLAGQEHFVFTTKLAQVHLDDAEGFASAPVIVQERIEPKVDLRVTVVGSRAFTASAMNVSEQDWRLEAAPVTFREFKLSQRLTTLCVEMAVRLGLSFAAIDLLESKGSTYFLELNPNGEWGWLQAAGLPIAEAIADELFRAD